MQQPESPPPCEQGSRKIQLPYLNRFETIWEYEKSFLAGRIDFFSFIGPACPICGDFHCYRQITPYWRYAIELFAEFTKKRIPIARFLCRRRPATFSLLPIQLIPYCQYTASAVIGTLLVGFGCWQIGEQGFWGASIGVHPDSLLSPWLVACWLMMVVRGFQRAHRVLRQLYDLSGIRTAEGVVGWQQAAGYFLVFGLQPEIRWEPLLHALLHRYCRVTRQFLFGTSSQQRHWIRA